MTAQFLQELVPVVLLGALAAAWRRGRPIASAAIVLLAAQRFLEMRGVYPTLPASTLAPPLPGLASMSSDAGSRDAGPSRVVAAGTNFRPNGATLYGLEDVRGYESLVLDRFADTYVLWCRAQPASFNLVTDLGAPFLGFLNARYAIGGPRDPAPAGWRERARTAELAVFENPLALPRAFVPRTLRREPDAGRRLEALRRETDFERTAWLSAPGAGRAEEPGGEAALRLREIGPDLAIEAEVATRAFVATSLPDWPGWRAIENGIAIPLETVNHAFVGFWLPPGSHAVRLRYFPPSWPLGLTAGAAGLLAAILMATTARRAS